MVQRSQPPPEALVAGQASHRGGRFQAEAITVGNQAPRALQFLLGGELIGELTQHLGDLGFNLVGLLRLKDGFELLRFTERTGLTLASIQQPLAEAEAKGLLQRDLARAWPTAKGFDFLSDLQAMFLKD